MAPPACPIPWRGLDRQLDTPGATGHSAGRPLGPAPLVIMLENRSILDRRGNIRLTSRPAARIERILKINPLTTVTKEVVETAREALVIGIL